jgi:hypothetical protein
MLFVAGGLAVLAGLFYTAGHHEIGSVGVTLCRYRPAFCDNPFYVLVAAGLAAVWGGFEGCSVERNNRFTISCSRSRLAGNLSFHAEISYARSCWATSSYRRIVDGRLQLDARSEPLTFVFSSRA